MALAGARHERKRISVLDLTGQGKTMAYKRPSGYTYLKWAVGGGFLGYVVMTLTRSTPEQFLERLPEEKRRAILARNPEIFKPNQKE